MTALSTAAAPRGTMTLRAHGTELRRRAVRAAVALAIGVVAGFALAPAILDVLRTPIEALAAERTASLNYDSLTGAFELTCSIALISRVLLSSPVWLFELLRFIAPGLTRREKRIGFIYLGIVIALFGAGAYCGFTIFPVSSTSWRVSLLSRTARSCPRPSTSDSSPSSSSRPASLSHSPPFSSC